MLRQCSITHGKRPTTVDDRCIVRVRWNRTGHACPAIASNLVLLEGDPSDGASDLRRKNSDNPWLVSSLDQDQPFHLTESKKDSVSDALFI